MQSTLNYLAFAKTGQEICVETTITKITLILLRLCDSDAIKILLAKRLSLMINFSMSTLITIRNAKELNSNVTTAREL